MGTQRLSNIMTKITNQTEKFGSLKELKREDEAVIRQQTDYKSLVLLFGAFNLYIYIKI